MYFKIKKKKVKFVPRRVAQTAEECAFGTASNKAKPRYAARLGQVCPQIKKHLQKFNRGT